MLDDTSLYRLAKMNIAIIMAASSKFRYFIVYHSRWVKITLTVHLKVRFRRLNRRDRKGWTKTSANDLRGKWKSKIFHTHPRWHRDSFLPRNAMEWRIYCRILCVSALRNLISKNLRTKPSGFTMIFVLEESCYSDPRQNSETWIPAYAILTS